MKKTPQQVDELKSQWLREGCWDIENTPGFEDYREELLAFRREQINRLMKGDHDDRIPDNQGSMEVHENRRMDSAGPDKERPDPG